MHADNCKLMREVAYFFICESQTNLLPTNNMLRIDKPRPARSLPAGGTLEYPQPTR